MPSDPPSEVQITVTVFRRDRAGWLRSRLKRSYALVTLALTVAALTAVAIVSLPGAPRSGPVTSPAEAKAVAAAFGYPYPIGCLRITTFGDFARAHVVRTGECARYRGYLNATFHFIGRHWRLVLDEGQLFVPNEQLVAAR